MSFEEQIMFKEIKMCEHYFLSPVGAIVFIILQICFATRILGIIENWIIG